MNRAYLPHRGGIEAGIVNLSAAVSIGAAGAPTTTALQIKGIASVVRSATGRYVITLQDQYVRLLAAQVTVVGTVARDSATVGTDIKVRSSAVTASTPTVTIQAVKADGTDAELGDGDQLLVLLTLKASSADEV
tara:strand:+ start:48 stop:449 length:402 start_codon:yes stop_codon:yes gene_type:complete